MHAIQITHSDSFVVSYSYSTSIPRSSAIFSQDVPVERQFRNRFWPIITFSIFSWTVQKHGEQIFYYSTILVHNMLHRCIYRRIPNHSTKRICNESLRYRWGGVHVIKKSLQNEKLHDQRSPGRDKYKHLHRIPGTNRQKNWWHK